MLNGSDNSRKDNNSDKEISNASKLDDSLKELIEEFNDHTSSKLAEDFDNYEPETDELSENMSENEEEAEAEAYNQSEESDTTVTIADEVPNEKEKLPEDDGITEEEVTEADIEDGNNQNSTKESLEPFDDNLESEAMDETEEEEKSADKEAAEEDTSDITEEVADVESDELEEADEEGDDESDDDLEELSNPFADEEDDDDDASGKNNVFLKALIGILGVVVVICIIWLAIIAQKKKDNESDRFALSSTENENTTASIEGTTAGINSTEETSENAVETTEGVITVSTEASSHAEESKENASETEAEESTDESTAEAESSSEATETSSDTQTPDSEFTDEKRKTVWEKYNNLGVICVENYLNIRSLPTTDSAVIGILSNCSGVDLLELSEDGGWYHIISNNVDGYISSAFVKTGDEAKRLAYENAFPAVKVIAEVLNVRSLPSVDSNTITQIINGTAYYVTEETNEEWLKISISAEIEGYVHRDFVTYEYVLREATPYQEPTADNTDTTQNDNVVTPTETVNPIRMQIVNTALSYLGGKYVWGGTVLGVGVDCSGFMMRIFELYGYQLPRTSYWQVDVGEPVSFETMQPGDLIFYWNNDNGRIGHVALYMGNNMIVHAASENRGIVIDDYRFMTPYCAKNVIGP